MKNHDARDVLASFTDENIVFVSGLDVGQVSVHEVELELVDGSGGDGHQALLTAFPFYFNETLIQVKIG